MTKYLVLHFDAEAKETGFVEEEFKTLEDVKETFSNGTDYEFYEGDRYTIIKQTENGEISIVGDAVVPPQELIWKKR